MVNIEFVPDFDVENISVKLKTIQAIPAVIVFTRQLDLALV